MIRRFLTNVGAFARLTALSFRALFGWLNPLVYASSLVIGPLFQVIFFALLGQYGRPDQGLDWFVIGNAVYGCALTSVFAVGASLSQDRSAGTLSLVLITPRSRLMLFAGRALVLMLHGVVTMLLGLTLGWALLGLDLSQTNVPGLALVLILVTLTSGALGLLAAAVSLVITDINLMLNSLTSLLLVLCGVNIAVDSLPQPLQWLSFALPMTRGVQAAREFIGGAPFADVAPLITGEALVGLIYVLVGYLLFLRMEYRARQAGTFDLV